MMIRGYTDNAMKTIKKARNWAMKLGSPYINPEHILLALIDEEESPINQIIKQFGINPKQLRSDLEVKFRQSNELTKEPELSSSFKKLLILALEEVKRRNELSISTKHLFLALCQFRERNISGVLQSYGIYYEEVEEKIKQMKEIEW